MSAQITDRFVAQRSERAALRRLWFTIAPVSLIGVFLAELVVMNALQSFQMSWGLLANLLDALLLTALILPGLYFVVLRPVSRLAARLALATADRRFRVVVEAASDGIIVGDRNARILFANGAAQRMLGYSRDEMEGSDLALIVPEEERERHREGMRRYLATGEGGVVGRGAVEMAARSKDGGRVPVELTLNAPTLDEEGLVVAVLRDLRQSRRIGLYESLLPVCCVCHRIRDDHGTARGRGEWTRLEDYVQQRASARFSHTYCAGCLAEVRRASGLP